MKAVAAILVAACVFCTVLGPVVFMPALGSASDTDSIMTLNVCQTTHGSVPVMGETPCIMTEAFTFKPAELSISAVPQSAAFAVSSITSEVERPPQA